MSSLKRPLLRAVLGLLSPLALSSCLQTSVEISSSGHFILLSYNGHELPFLDVQADKGCSVDLEDGDIWLYTDKTWELNLGARGEGECAALATARYPKRTEGTYVESGFGAVTLTSYAGYTGQGVVTGDGMTYYDPAGNALQFRE